LEGRKPYRGCSKTKSSGSKKETVLELLRRKEGATIEQIANATDWQKHSIRGFLSGMVTKKMGLTLESAKNEQGVRTYRIA
jgi:predicted ArsR family transcriptional regulator